MPGLLEGHGSWRPGDQRQEARSVKNRTQMTKGLGGTAGTLTLNLSHKERQALLCEISDQFQQNSKDPKAVVPGLVVA